MGTCGSITICPFIGCFEFFISSLSFYYYLFYFLFIVFIISYVHLIFMVIAFTCGQMQSNLNLLTRMGRQPFFKWGQHKKLASNILVLISISTQCRYSLGYWHRLFLKPMLQINFLVMYIIALKCDI